MLVEFSVALEEVCILKRWWLMVRSYLLHIFMNYSLKESENRFQKQQHKLHFSNHKARFFFVVQNVLLETRVRACKTWGSFGRGAGSGSLTSFPLPYSPSLPGYSTPLHTWLTKYGSQVGALTKFPRWCLISVHPWCWACSGSKSPPAPRPQALCLCAVLA